MADPNDVVATKLLRREFTKRQLDISMADLRVSHGVAQIRGVIRLMRGASGDPHEITYLIARHLRARPEIRDVVVDATFRQ